MENCFPHVFRVVLLVCSASPGPSLVESVVKGPEDKVLKERGAVGDAKLHGAFEGFGEEFRPCVECPFYCVL